MDTLEKLFIQRDKLQRESSIASRCFASWVEEYIININRISSLIDVELFLKFEVI